MKKTITIRLEDRKSRYYPVAAYLKINGIEYSLVFESLEEVQRYSRRFYPNRVVFHDKREGVADHA